MNCFMYVQSTLQSSGVSLKFKPRVSNIYPHSKQSNMMGGVKYEMVSDVLTWSCNNGDVRSLFHQFTNTTYKYK